MSVTQATSASHSITIRLKLANEPGTLARVMTAVGEAGGNIGAVDIVRVDHESLIRDITVNTSGADHQSRIEAALNALGDIEIIHVSDRTFLLHLGGKIEVVSKTPVETRDQLSMAYTPGVARVCKAIAEQPSKAYTLTIKKNTVAVVTDGTAVLGLGDIGPKAAMPVMEGKAQLFKEFGGVDAFPICLDTKDVDEIVRTVKLIAPGFGGINLEDISAPRCFEVETRLKEELDIPVFHDDQHGTAVVFIAGLINALKVVNKKPEDLKVVFVGTGAAGTACTHMLKLLGVTNIIGIDSKGAISLDREDLSPDKAAYAKITNPNNERGTLSEVIAGADVFVGLSVPDVLTVDDLKRMAEKPIVFAMANPDPEIQPELAYPHVAVLATGRSDYPNQINNVLCFPGMFRGALACRATDINEEMKMAAAYAIADSVETVYPNYIIPSVFDKT
ncbi:MAG: malic enzyme-like NAD(P)-binding protein, partial [Bacteroidota bacterium]